METSIPVIPLTGSAHERGVAHGAALQERIGKNVALYMRLISLEPSILEKKAVYFAELVAKVAPELKEEMDGIAEGARVHPWQIYMLNARTELLAAAHVVRSECATFYFSKTHILAENWDWSQDSADKVAVLDIEFPNGKRVLTFTEAGILAKVGITSRGFGVAFNYLYPAAELNGLPVHCLLRLALEAESFESAATLLSAGHPGTCGNILLADEEGRMKDFELSGKSTAVVEGDSSGLFHTNHYLGGTENSEEAGPGFLSNSYERFERAKKLFTTTDSYTLEDAQRFLLDREGAGGMLCRDFLPEDPGDDPTGTVASMVMDLKKGSMEVALLPQEGGKFEKIGTVRG